MQLGNRAVWVSWYSHRRTESLARRWDVPIVLIETQRSGALLKLLSKLTQTSLLLWRVRKKLVIVQNPSLGLTIVALALRPLLGYRLAVDAHNEGVHPYIRDNFFFRSLARLILRASPLTIVSNRYLAESVHQYGGRAAILPDPLPEIVVPLSSTKDANYALVIATYAPDEPLEEILQAASLLDPDVEILITGRPSADAREALRRTSTNVRPLGFLPDAEYLSMLGGAMCAIDLTKMDECLVCGAYEAIALGVPIIVTDSRAARDLFPRAVKFVDNAPRTIADAVRDLSKNADNVRAEIAILKKDYSGRWLRWEAETVERLIALEQRSASQ